MGHSFSIAWLPGIEISGSETPKRAGTERECHMDHGIRELMERKDRWIVLSTIGPDGFPHSIPIGYFFCGEKLVLGCRDQTQKIKNIERNPKVSLLWENGRGKDELIGMLLRGQARVVRDDQERLALKAEAARQRGESEPTSLTPGAVYIEITPEKEASWRKPSRGKRATGSTK